GILINLPQRLVFQFEGGRLIGAYPAAVGRVAPQWRTATGTFRVIQIREDPVWRVPDDVREEAHLNGRVIKARIEPGPDNPLGDYWLGLSLPELGIHGTNSPLSIYGFRTHGCIRLSPDDIEELYDGVDLGDGGEIIYEPVMFAKLDDGRVFLEVNRDAYKRGMSGMDFVHGLATNLGVVSMIDWKRAQQVVAAEEGIARDVTLAPGSEMKKVRGALRELLR
ncbi:MAG TPA: L,D-transpeptidase, partial [Candidatus Binataceae bacterium]|nr:L,D-transpeptidase [Candidatus Binataceae bacterium]